MERTSVRAFVEFLLREGDIDNRIRASSENAMREGTRIHKKIQSMRGPSYQAEVPFSFTFDTGRYTIRIDGRADGVMEGTADAPAEEQLTLESLSGEEKEAAFDFDTVPMIEEIKGTYRNVSKMEEAVPVHLAQAKCYAHFLCLERKLSHVRVRLTYCHFDTEEIRFFQENVTAKELSAWFSALLARYIVWTDFIHDHRIRRDRSIKETAFPFSYRKGQHDLAAAVYRTIVHGKKLFLEAPTGSGKTLATLFPAVKAIAEGKAARLFYLTAHTITRTAPEEAFRLMRKESALFFRTITLTAKEKICLSESCTCNPDACMYAKGHFDRINDAVYDILTHEECLTREVILQYARKHTVCPFEFSLDLTLFADGIICDYNYLFDPFVCLRRFFAEGESKDHLFLVDEAHNLVERGRNMYSVSLSGAYLHAHLALTRGTGAVRKVRTALQALLTETDALRTKLSGKSYCMFAQIDMFFEKLIRLHQALTELLDQPADVKNREELLALYLELFRFRTIYEGMDARYRIYGEAEGTDDFHLRILCVDPSDDLAACMAKGVSSVLFSATLLPIRYYKRLLGANDDDFDIYAETSFPPGNCLQVIVDDVSSRYTARGEESYRNIARIIREVRLEKEGNYMVFFPSFAFLYAVLAHYRQEADEAERLIVQSSDMDEASRERVLSAFRTGAFTGGTERDGSFAEEAPKPKLHMEIEEVGNLPVTLFAVLGGIFHEGVDLPGEALIGVLIVGTGLPAVCTERDILRDYFDESGEDGYDYAYRFPGMNRVLQAAGRVIRTEHDKGIVVLMDDRFTTKAYQSLFPREWQQRERCGTEKVRQVIGAFWDGEGEKT